MLKAVMVSAAIGLLSAQAASAALPKTCAQFENDPFPWGPTEWLVSGQLAIDTAMPLDYPEALPVLPPKQMTQIGVDIHLRCYFHPGDTFWHAVVLAYRKEGVLPAGDN